MKPRNRSIAAPKLAAGRIANLLQYGTPKPEAVPVITIEAIIQESLDSAEPNRREFLGLGGGAIVGAVAGTLVIEPFCDKKDLSGWVLTLTTAFGEIKPLLGQLGLSQAVLDRVSGFIDKGVKIAQDFDAAYKAGKFADARTLFLNLGDIVAQVAAELGASDNRIVKLALISISIARIAIAALLSSQASQPGVMAAVNKAKSAGGDDAKAIAEIERLSAIDVTKLLAAIQ